MFFVKSKLALVIGIEVVIIASSLLWGGCMSLPLPPQYPPQTRVIHVPLPPDLAYHHAYITLTKFGGVIVGQDEHMRVVTGEVHNAAIINLVIEPEGKGSQITITGHIMKNKVVTGDFDEVQTLATLLQTP